MSLVRSSIRYACIDMPRGGGRGGRGKGGPPPKRGAFHSSSVAAGGAPSRVHIPDGRPVDLSRHKDVEWVEIDGSVLEGVSVRIETVLHARGREDIAHPNILQQCIDGHAGICGLLHLHASAHQPRTLPISCTVEPSRVCEAQLEP